MAVGLRLTLAVVFALPLALLVPLLEPVLLPVVGEVLAPLLAMTPAVLALIFPLLTLSAALRRVERQFAIRCPGCGQHLHQCGAVVIASRNCPYCGGTVIQGD